MTAANPIPPPAGVVTSIKRALVNLLDMDEVLMHLSRDWSDRSSRDLLIKRIEAIVACDSTCPQEVRKCVGAFLTMPEYGLTVQQRSALDATIRRLVLLLAPADQMQLAPSLLLHQRAARRRVGATIIRSHPDLAQTDIGQALLVAYERYHDPEVLTPLTGVAADVRDIAAQLLAAFGELPDPRGINRSLRERAAVFERLLAHDAQYAAVLGDQYPAAFIYGVGRARYKEGVPQVEVLVAAARQTYESTISVWLDGVLTAPANPDTQRMREEMHQAEECMRLGIWALGKLEAKDALVRWAEVYGVEWTEVGEFGFAVNGR